MKGNRWTKEEEAYLEKYHGRISQKNIAAKLGKSVGSVREKSRRMGLGNLEEAIDGMTCSAISRIVGVCRKTVNTTWIQKGLKAKKINKYMVVKEDDLLEFMQSHPELWDARKCDYYFFQRFDWFVEKLSEDRTNNPQGQRPWTKQEEVLLLSMRERNVPYKKIAERLGRNWLSVSRKYSYLITNKYKKGA